ncbi:hypothetical protein [Catellatospora sp. NPDC049609]|uniref:hypothetical protein n=1 Tax=Catellatospora sp. NPDC049609 TaxID=3155505 RepID=UPI00342D4404
MSRPTLARPLWVRDRMAGDYWRRTDDGMYALLTPFGWLSRCNVRPLDWIADAYGCYAVPSPIGAGVAR